VRRCLTAERLIDFHLSKFWISGDEFMSSECLYAGFICLSVSDYVLCCADSHVRINLRRLSDASPEISSPRFMCF
jgi:hypothetical protein